MNQEQIQAPTQEPVQAQTPTQQAVKVIELIKRPILSMKGFEWKEMLGKNRKQTYLMIAGAIGIFAQTDIAYRLAAVPIVYYTMNIIDYMVHRGPQTDYDEKKQLFSLTDIYKQQQEAERKKTENDNNKLSGF